MMDPTTIHGLQETYGRADGLGESCALDIAGCRVLIRSNSAAAIEALGDYFRAYRVSGVDAPHFTCAMVQRHPLQLDQPWQDWPREAGKSGLKERCADLEDGRLVWKVRTGMMFLLRPALAMAVGPCEDNLNQVINLVNNQYISWVMARDWQLCHAAGVGLSGAGLGLAGVSGAGKSTLALRLIERGADFVSNDRLLVSGCGADVLMRGIPKQPRVNPGTLLTLPSLEGILDSKRAAELRALPAAELWDLEEKYDVDVERVYGEGRQAAELPLRAFCVLTWSFRNEGPSEVLRTTLRERPDLLGPIMKHPGPFFHTGERYDTRGSACALEPEPYLAVLGDTPLLEISGGVDFPRALDACLEALA